MTLFKTNSDVGEDQDVAEIKWSDHILFNLYYLLILYYSYAP
jgi:hypothetical protein